MMETPEETMPETTPMEERGKKRRPSVLSGTIWTFSGTVGRAVIQFLVVIALSRLLTPEEVGYATAAMAVANLSELLSQMGIAAAVVQRPSITSAHMATAYITSVVLGLLQTVLVFIFAGPIAGLLNMPPAEPLIRAISMVFLFTALGRIARSRLSRGLAFGKIAKVEVIAMVGYGGVSVVLAMLGSGAWAMVYGLIVQALLTSALLVAGQPFPRPFRFDREAYRDMMSVAKGFSAGAILNYVASQADNFVVARWMGSAPLGVYSRSWNLMARPAVMFASSISQVLYPTMARVQDQKAQLRALFRRSSVALAIVVMPAGLVLSILAPEVILVLLGEKWREAIVPFQILSAGMFFRIGNQSSDSITRALGDNFGRIFPKAVYAASVVGMAFYGIRWGLAGVSWGVLAANVVHTLVITQIALNRIEMGWRECLGTLRTPIIVSIILSMVVYLVAFSLRAVGAPMAFILLASLSVGAVVFLGLIRFGGRPFLGDEVFDLANSVNNLVMRKLGKGRASGTKQHTEK